VMILIPYTTFGLYPLLKRLGWDPHPLRRMTVGMFMAALAFVAVALIQAALDGGASVPVAWHLLPYAIMTLSEVMVSITGLEFAYTQAPKRMKSAVMSFWLFSIFLGNLMVVFLAGFEDMEAVMFFWAFAGIIAFAMVEPLRHRPTEQHPLDQMRGVIVGVLRGPIALRAVMTLGICLSLASFIPVWIIQIYATDAGVPVAWLGPIWAIANYIVAFGAITSPMISRRIGLMPTLAGCVALLAIGYLGLGVTHAWWGFAFYFALVAMRGINGPILHHEEQRLVPSSDRAGFISFRSLLFRGSFVLVGPAAGFAIDRWGAHPVLLVLGVALTCATLFGWSWMRRSLHEPMRSVTM
jgi:hypothetical protein